MIKITRSDKPIELTEEIESKLTEEFKMNSKAAVWNKNYIRDALLKMTDNKCCYCECFIGPGHKEMHVDHFHPKGKYPDEVVKWENLLPSCPHCNKNKSDHDTYLERIIDPCNDDPREYFYFKLYRYYSKDTSPNSFGKLSIEVLNLNNTTELVQERFAIGEVLQSKLEDMVEMALGREGELKSNTRLKNRVVNGCKSVLRMASREAEFAAFMATVIHNEDNYSTLVSILKRNDLWDDDLENLHNNSLKIKFDTH